VNPRVSVQKNKINRNIEQISLDFSKNIGYNDAMHRKK